MKNIKNLKLIKTLFLLIIIMVLDFACAVRTGPSIITGLSLAELPEPAPIIAVPLSTDIPLAVKTGRGLQFMLNAVLFQTNQANLLPEGKLKVEELAETIKQHTSRTILIEGHTDNMGDKSYNQQLSKRRAKMVQKVLIAQGINPEQLVIKAFGENNPIATNTTSQGRQQNRRVEIVILKKGIIP